MKLISWNVNGLRACLGKGLPEFFAEEDADIFCMQETKLSPGNPVFAPEGYYSYYNCAEKKGYSGTAALSKQAPLSVRYGMDGYIPDSEGRILTLEFPELYLVTCYSPNSQHELARLPYRLEWERAMRCYLATLDEEKPVVLCGDLNVAHKEIDLKNPRTNRMSAGFSDEERAAFSSLQGAGFTDTFRLLYPEKTGAYTWWSYITNSRATNAGWRIDYFVASDRLAGKVCDAVIYSEVLGSDHCPVGLVLDI